MPWPHSGFWSVPRAAERGAFVMKPLFLSGTISGRPHAWPLDQPRIGVGRSAANFVQIHHGTVSKEHAEIVAEGDRFVLRDLGGRNGTRVNGVLVRHPVPLRLGDRLKFGDVELCVTDSGTAPDAALSDSRTLTTTLRIPAAEVLRRGPAGGPSPPGVVRGLAAVGGLLVLQTPLAETCDQLLRIVEEVVPASRLVLLVRPHPDTKPVQIAARCHGEIKSEPLLMSRAILGTVLEGGSSVITTDAMADSRFAGSGSVAALKTRSAMAAPLCEGGRIQGLLYADQDEATKYYGAGDLELLTLIGNMIAVKVANDRLMVVQQRLMRLEHELAVAARIQRGLLPAEPPAITGYECHAVVQSCEEVGGDLYDFHPMPDGSIYFIVGDVAGKGIAAALLMSHFMACADALYGLCQEPADLATRLNAAVARRVESVELVRPFVTAFIGRLEPATGLLRYANAGHPTGILIGQGPVQELLSAGPPCGAVPDFAYPGGVVHVAPGGLIAVYSDGIPEARKGEGEFFEVSRLVRLLVEESHLRPLGRLSRRVLDEVDAFLDGEPRQDDVTLLLLRNATSHSPS